VTGDWRDWRPAIWLAMLGVALVLLISPPYIGGVAIGGAIGVAIRIYQRRRLTTAATAGGARARKRKRRR
jgi:hypothetical protein